MAKDLTSSPTRVNPETRIAPIFVQGLLAGPVSRNVDVRALLQRVGIAPEVLGVTTHDSGAGITPTQYSRLFQALMHEMQDECPGMLSRPFKPGSFALTVREGRSAPDLRRAIKRMCQALNLLQDDFVFSLDATQGEAGLKIQGCGGNAPSAAPPTASAPAPAPAPVHTLTPALFTQETLVRVLWRLASWLLNAPLPIAHFDFMGPAPAEAAVYPLAFPAPRRYGQGAFGFWFSPQALTLPIARDEPAMSRFLSDAYTQVLSSPRHFGLTSTKVRNCLIRNYPQWPSLQAVARTLNSSASSLQRHLLAESSSFQAIKDDLRRDLAISRLSTTQVSLQTLALELGFSDSSAFQRAFKQWTGQPCSAFRKGHKPKLGAAMP